MSTLVVVAYPNEFQAEEVRLRLLKMQKEYLVDLEDAVIAIRKENGRIKLLQLHNLTGAGALSGGFWGLLVGLLFMNPLLGAAVGAGAGAVSGALADVGIDDAFMKDLGRNLRPGGSMLFVLFRSITMDKALKELEGTGGTIIQTSLSHEDEERLRKAMDGADAGHECDAAEEAISRNAGKSSNLRCAPVENAPDDESECDAAEETISRNAGKASNLRCGGSAGEKDAPAEEFAVNTECDAAEEAISRNAGKNSNLRCAPAEESAGSECDPAEEAISRNADRSSNLRC